jgi:hypothetical protein
VGPSLRLSRVVALTSGLALVAAFFMPWFSSQGLLLSGQFLHSFLTSASQADLRRFLPGSSPTEVQLLRVLVDLFPVCGFAAALFALLGGLYLPIRVASNAVTGIAGLLPLVAWLIGIGRLPAGAAPEIGLWLIAAGSVGVLLGLTFELVGTRRAKHSAVRA